jgi:hypothetical protein
MGEGAQPTTWNDANNKDINTSCTRRFSLLNTASPSTHHEPQPCQLRRPFKFHPKAVARTVWQQCMQTGNALPIFTANSMTTKAAKIDPVQYDPDIPFKYNNFIYHINLPSTPSIARNNDQSQPGTDPIPDGAKDFIIRLTNPDAEGMHASTRVENEVAMISLAAAALSSLKPRVVPSVYAWGSAAAPSSQGWILQELMPGVPLDETFDNMPLEEKKVVLSQMASFLKALQDFGVPQSIKSYGGVTFDATGQVVSTTMTSVGSGPWQSYEAYFTDCLQRALQSANSNPYIQGWHANGVRKRLDAFVGSGIPAQFKGLKSKLERCIVHADFSRSSSFFLYFDCTRLTEATFSVQRQAICYTMFPLNASLPSSITTSPVSFTRHTSSFALLAAPEASSRAGPISSLARRRHYAAQSSTASHRHCPRPLRMALTGMSRKHGKTSWRRWRYSGRGRQKVLIRLQMSTRFLAPSYPGVLRTRISYACRLSR